MGTWAQRERTTARLVRACFRHVDRHPTADRLVGLCRLTWITKPQGWRGDALSRRSTTWRGLDEAFRLRGHVEAADPPFRRPRALISLGVPSGVAKLASLPAGIVNFRCAFRPSVRRWVEARKGDVLRLMRMASKLRDDTSRIELAHELARIDRLPRHGLKSWPRTLLSPVLSCLDPDGRFPIVNDGTRFLREALGMSRWTLPETVSGLLALYPWKEWGLADAADLDSGGWNLAPTPAFVREATIRIRRQLDGLKPAPERRPTLKVLDDSLVETTTVAASRKYERVHHRLTNRLVRLLGDRVHRPGPHDDCFDAFVRGDGRRLPNLLIEVKPNLGVRVSLRMAIGQLFDYRRRLDPEERKRLRLVAFGGARPPDDAVALLDEVGLDAAWFVGPRGSRIDGTGRAGAMLRNLTTS